MFKVIKKINKIINFVDNKNFTKFWLINLFFLFNAFFQLLFIFSFYLLVQSFSDPLKVSNNEILIFFVKILGLDHDLITSNNFLILIFTMVVIFSNLIFIFSNLFKFNFSYDLLTNLRSKLYNYYLGQNFEQFIKKNNAEYLTIILSDCERFAMQIVGNFLNISLASISLFLILVPVFVINFQVSLIVFLFLLTIFYLAGKNLKPLLNKLGEKIKTFSKNRYEIMNDSLRNFNEIKLENLDIKKLPELEQYMLHRIYSLNENFNKYFRNYDFHNLYKELLNFCTVDLSAFYFDIRKDTLYCDPKDSNKRKSTLTLLNVILDTLLKWFAPILSFTTEEIYQLISKKNKSIHLQKFIQMPKNFQNLSLNKKWLELIKIRNFSNVSIEEKRSSKEIGSSLEANLKIKLNDKYKDIVKNIDFSELCITSNAEITFSEKIEIEVNTSKAKGVKCPVCWKINPNSCVRHPT